MTAILIAVDDEWRISVAPPDEPVSFVVFEEVVAAEREDVVAEAVEFLATVRGVTAVEHVEREIVEITAPGVPAAHLTATLRRWWDAAAKKQRPWMTAMEHAVGTVAGLAPGYERRDGMWLTRVVDAELTHALALDHSFGRGPDEHTVGVSAWVQLTLPGTERFHVVRRSLDLADEAALVEAVTGDLLPALEALPSVDAMLDRWRDRRSLAVPGYHPYPVYEAELHARVLVARGRLDEAREVYQDAYEREQLRTLTGVDLDGSRRSLEQVWVRLRESADHRRGRAGDGPPRRHPPAVARLRDRPPAVPRAGGRRVRPAPAAPARRRHGPVGGRRQVPTADHPGEQSVTSGYRADAPSSIGCGTLRRCRS